MTVSLKRRDAPGKDGADGANCGRMAQEQGLSIIEVYRLLPWE